jgi:hypothetical protein
LITDQNAREFAARNHSLSHHPVRHSTGGEPGLLFSAGPAFTPYSVTALHEAGHCVAAAPAETLRGLEKKLT